MLLSVVDGLLIAVTSLAVEHQLWGARPSVAEVRGLRSFGCWALPAGFLLKDQLLSLWGSLCMLFVTFPLLLLIFAVCV